MSQAVLSDTKPDTPSDAFEKEIIRATRRLPVAFEDWDGNERTIMLLPIPNAVFVEGAELLTDLVAELTDQYFKISIAIRKLTKVEEPDAPVGDSGGDIFDVIPRDLIVQTISRIPGVIEFILSNGVDIDYAELEQDSSLCAELVLRVLDHNYGKRLAGFLSPGGKDFKRLLTAVKDRRASSASSEPVPNSPDGDTAEPISTE